MQSNTSVHANKPVYVVLNDGDTVFAGTEGHGLISVERSRHNLVFILIKGFKIDQGTFFIGKYE